LEKETVPSAMIKPTFDTITKTVERISKIVEGLRSFSRETDESETELVKLSQVVTATLTFCQEKFKSNGVSLEIEGDQEIWVDVNPQQIEQVLLNLLNNAFYAVKEEKERRVVISADSEDQVVRLRVTDSGAGIPKDVADRIFQPFFTTKPVGAGTGLGLGISYGIAQRHGGQLYLDQTAKNTTFVLELEKSQRPDEEKLDSAQPKKANAA
ncbi:MAG: ATP-binding protein, partial [Pseudomonadota bacterium]